jgi:hypothetical protein
MLIEWLHRGKPTALGLASGVVAGLVAVTPASGYVTPLGALAIGLIAGGVCYGAVLLKPSLKYDDSLDAFGVHGVGGFLGAVLTGVFASAALYKAGSGSDLADVVPLLKSGAAGQVMVQLTAAVAAAAYGFVGSLVLVKVIDAVFGFTLEPRAEAEGLDANQHGEAGFDFGPHLDASPEHFLPEPRSATVPPNGVRRFTVVVEGANNGDLMHTWSGLCQAGDQPPAPEFKTVYPFLTTVQGNRFRFRGGDPGLMRENLERLFQNKLDGTPIKTYIES